MKAAELFGLDGQVAFVTGAARGLGFAMAETLAENGATVMLTDIDAEALDAAVRHLADKGLSVASKVLDVADLAGLTAAIDDTANLYGKLDIVCANAGVSAGPGPLSGAGGIANVSLERWEQLLRINLTSVFVTIRSAAAHMRPRKSGRIIVTASIAGIRAEWMCGYAYASTKAAVNNLVRQAAIELSSDNVMINAIAPGPFLTDIGNGRLRQADVAADFASDVLLGRIGRPDEIKGLTLLLASKASSYVTGTVIPVDGGATAW